MIKKANEGAKCVLGRGELKQDLAPSRGGQAQKLCMAQYYRILNTYRLPGELGDRQESSGRGEQSRDEEHVIIMKDCKVSWFPYMNE